MRKAKGRRVPVVLKAYRTTKQRGTDETPFSLAYGSEGIIPIEVILPTLHLELSDSSLNEVRLRHNLDLLKERREQEQIILAAYQHLAHYYNCNLRRRAFRVENHVLRNVRSNSREIRASKLGLKWEGHNRVTFAVEKGAYYLKDLQRNALP